MNRVLLQTVMFEVTAYGPVAVCELRQRDDVTPEQGASAAHQLAELLKNDVFPSTEFNGLVIDARLGPPVFGPRTRKAIAEMLSGAAKNNKRLSIVVNDLAIQRLQYTAICNEVAPRCSKVGSDLREMRTWAAKRDL